MGGARFFVGCKHQFSKGNNNTYQKSTILNEPFGKYISSNVGFRPKIYKLGPIGPKMGGARFFLDCNSQFSKRRT